MDKHSGVGVVDKSVALMDAIAERPRSLSELVEATGIPRPTAHRLALALESHDILDRDQDGRFTVGSRTARWATGVDALRRRAEDVVRRLRDESGVSAQVYRRAGDQRLCIAAAEPAAGLRDTVPVGSLLTLRAGSAAQILVAWLPEDERAQLTRGAAFTRHDLEQVRRRGWAHSVAQREPGVASLSMPALSLDGSVVAAVSISGPVSRLARPSAAQRRTLADAALALTA